MDKIKVGIIGSGFIAEHHCYSYNLNQNVEIIGMASLLEEEARELMKKFRKFLKFFCKNPKKKVELCSLT